MPTLELYAAGSNSHGQLGLGHQNDVHVFQKCEIDLEIKDYDSVELKICAGAVHTLLLVSHDGQKELLVAGSSRRTQLGVKTHKNQTIFKKLSMVDLLAKMSNASTTDWQGVPLQCEDIAAAWETSFFLLSRLKPDDNKRLLICSGANDQALHGSRVGVDALHVFPHQFDGKIMQIAAGPRNGMLLMNSGEVRVWGASRHGQIPGYTHEATQFHPRLLQGQIVDVPAPSGRLAAGLHHIGVASSAALSFKVLGDNRKGQLGLHNNDATHRQNTVDAIDPSHSGTSTEPYTHRIFANWNSTFMLRQGALVLDSCGSNGAGQLGRFSDKLGDVAPVDFPEDTAGFKITQVAAGSEHTLAVLEKDNERRIYGWGWNEHGNLGRGDDKLDDVFRPERISQPCDGRILSVHAGNGTSWIAMVREWGK